jgi:antitoxin component HigA of HigAB toxin-antitoxin module
MAKLEDAYERNPKSSALPKALNLLRDATDKHLLTLRALKPELTTENEASAISGAIYEAETANKGARDGLK